MAARKAKKVTTTKEWKQKAKAVELELPSGNVCLAKRKAMTAFLKSGKIPNSLMPIVQKHLDVGGKNSVKEGELSADLSILAQDENALQGIMDMADMIVIECVVEPTVYPVPEDEENRDPLCLYIDEVDEEDRMFIMSWAVGGTRDTERFREESASVMDNVSGSEAMASKT